MSKVNDGGPAFAAIGVAPAGDLYHQPGMDLRDWFAGQALTELATFISVKHQDETSKVIARLSYTIADAMLAARSGESA